MAPEDPGRGGPGAPLSAGEVLAAVLTAAAPFAAVLVFGAARLDTALAFAAVYGLLAAGLFIGCGWARGALGRMEGLAAPAILFAATLAAVAWPLTALVPGGPHPAWDFVEASPAGAVSRSVVLVQMLELVSLGALFLSAACIAARPRRGRLLLGLLLALAAAYSVWAVAAHVAGPDQIYGAPKRVHPGRLTGSFYSANTVGAFFGLWLVLMVAAAFARLRRRPGGSFEGFVTAVAPPLAGAVVAGGALLLTASRGAATATLAALLVLFAWRGLSRGRRWAPQTALLALSIAGVGLVMAWWRGGWVAARMASLGQDAVGRTDLWAPHWAAFRASPWTGYGLGAFDTLNQAVKTRANYASLWDIHAAHNLYLQWLEEAGLVGAGLMLATLATVLVAIARGNREQPEAGLEWRRGIVAASLVLLVQGVSDFAVQAPAIQALWAVLLGAGLGLRQPRRPACEPAAEQGEGPRTSWRGLATGGLSAVVAAWAGVGAAALWSPAWGSGLPFPLIPASETYGLAADTHLMAGWPSADRAELARSRALTERELSLSPMSGAGWLRLALIDSRLSGGMTDAALSALGRSYAVAPFDVRLLASRVRFSYEHWGELSPSLRGQALSQIDLAWASDPYRARLFDALGAVQDPGGRLALQAEFASLQSRDRLRSLVRQAQALRGAASNRAGGAP